MPRRRLARANERADGQSAACRGSSPGNRLDYPLPDAEANPIGRQTPVGDPAARICSLRRHDRSRLLAVRGAGLLMARRWRSRRARTKRWQPRVEIRSRPAAKDLGLTGFLPRSARPSVLGRGGGICDRHDEGDDAVDCAGWSSALANRRCRAGAPPRAAAPPTQKPSGIRSRRQLGRKARTLVAGRRIGRVFRTYSRAISQTAAELTINPVITGSLDLVDLTGIRLRKVYQSMPNIA